MARSLVAMLALAGRTAAYAPAIGRSSSSVLTRRSVLAHVVRGHVSMTDSGFGGRIVVGADGFGEELKNAVVKHLRDVRGLEVEDVGTDKYFVAAATVARAVQAGGSAAGGAEAGVRGMLFCGTGMGVSVIANKFSGISAAVVENESAARASRAINDANICCMGGLVTAPAEASVIADAWLEQQHGQPPVAAGAAPPEWWSPEVEEFLAAKWPEIGEIEKESRAA